MKKDNYVVSFMNLYSLVLHSFKDDCDYYNIIINYNIENNLFSVNVFNMSKNINAFYKDFVIDLKNACFFRDIIRDDFINNYKIYLPYVQNDIHIIKGYKFSLVVPIFKLDFDNTEKAQKKALKKMLV